MNDFLHFSQLELLFLNVALFSLMITSTIALWIGERTSKLHWEKRKEEYLEKSPDFYSEYRMINAEVRQLAETRREVGSLISALESPSHEDQLAHLAELLELAKAVDTKLKGVQEKIANVSAADDDPDREDAPDHVKQ